MGLDLQGRTCLVTGATSGIGRATARALARRGARLIVLARSESRATALRDEVARETGCEIEVVLADLTVQAQVREAAARILERCPALHVLVNNAGLVSLKRTTTPDGIETTFAVNHLAYFLLTSLLLERLVATPGARIVNVASDAHKFVRGMNWDDLGFERGYGWAKVYGQSKLANLLFTRELSRRLEGSGVTANALHPGAVGTRLGADNNGLVGRLLTGLLRPFFRTPEKGAETSVHLATAPALEGVSGGYFADCRPHASSAAARDDAAARRLWAVSGEMTGLAG